MYKLMVGAVSPCEGVHKPRILMASRAVWGYPTCPTHFDETLLFDLKSCTPWPRTYSDQLFIVSAGLAWIAKIISFPIEHGADTLFIMVLSMQLYWLSSLFSIPFSLQFVTGWKWNIFSLAVTSYVNNCNCMSFIHTHIYKEFILQ